MLTVFGYCGASPELRRSFAQFAAMLGKRIHGEVELFEAASYEDLTTAVVSRYVDVAWVPPIPFVSLARLRAVVPLVQLRRGGSNAFRSALVVRDASPIRGIADLVGKRAAWVDRYSASGFAMPRMELARLGFDLRTAFASQRFFHSHEAVVRAVTMGIADFGATYAGVASDGRVARGPWLFEGDASPSLRVVAFLGDIPGDVVAARAGTPEGVHGRMRDALLRVSSNRTSKLLARGAFGVDEFCAFDSSGYADFEHRVRDAAQQGLLDVGIHPDVSGAHSLW